MTETVVTTRVLAWDLESAHRRGVQAAIVGLQDAGLGENRLAGSAVPTLAEAAVTSATPYLRAPLLARIHRVSALHPAAGGPDEVCPTCQLPAPCPTAKELT